MSGIVTVTVARDGISAIVEPDTLGAGASCGTAPGVCVGVVAGSCVGVVAGSCASVVVVDPGGAVGGGSGARSEATPPMFDGTTIGRARGPAPGGLSRLSPPVLSRTAPDSCPSMVATSWRMAKRTGRPGASSWAVASIVTGDAASRSGEGPGMRAPSNRPVSPIRPAFPTMEAWMARTTTSPAWSPTISRVPLASGRTSAPRIVAFSPIESHARFGPGRMVGAVTDTARSPVIPTVSTVPLRTPSNGPAVADRVVFRRSSGPSTKPSTVTPPRSGRPASLPIRPPDASATVSLARRPSGFSVASSR